MPIARTSLAAVAAALLLTLVFAASAAPPAQGRAQVEAEIAYREGADGSIRDVRLQIHRDGVRVVDLPPVNPCESCELLPVPPDYLAPARVVQLDATLEPEVVFTLYSGGAHCCIYTEVFRWDEAAGRYLFAVHQFPEVGYRLERLRGDGPPLFVGVDGRLAGRFSCSVCGGAPPQVWEYRRGRFAEVTRAYPRLVKRELAPIAKAYRRTRGKTDVRGLLATMVADKCLVGSCGAGFRLVRRAIRAGHVRPFERFEYGPHGKRYLRVLRRVLTRLGYA